MNTIVMQIESAVCKTADVNQTSGGREGSDNVSQATEEGSQNIGNPNQNINSEISQPIAIVSNQNIESPTTIVENISVKEPSSVVDNQISKQTSVISTIVTSPAQPVFSSTMFTEAPVKDLPTDSSDLLAKQETLQISATNSSPVLTSNRQIIRSISQNSELTLENFQNISPQKIYNIVPTSQKLNQQQSATVQKIMVNNNNNNNDNNGARKLQTITSVNALQKGLTTSNPLKVHVVNSKHGNLGIKTPMQVQRQIVSNVSPKIDSTKLVNKQMLSSKNNLLAKQQSQAQTYNNVQKSYKTINRPVQQHPNKTIKTLSPQSPQNYLQKTGIKTLSPQNHLGKTTNSLKMLHNAANQVQRMGIKTLAPQRPTVMNNRQGSMTPKPNYIGKHAIQAHKAHKGGPHMPGAKGRMPPRGSPPKYMQKTHQVHQNINQSSFNQSLTAQILQSLPQTGRSEVFSGKNFAAPQVHSPTDLHLSDDIGEEFKPEMSPDVNYYYQVVMLDHNYSSSVAPTPAISPRAPEPMPQHVSSARQQSVGQQSPIGVHNGVPNTQVQTYHYGGGSKRHRLNSGSSLPPTISVGIREISNPVNTEIQMQHEDDAASTISCETHRDHPGEEGEETETAPEGEGDEDGITHCICDYDHDDGYMICCDICSSWQHVDCMGLDREHIPEKYACVRCEPRRVDRAHARAIQQRKREELAATSGNSSGSDTSTTESTGGGDNRPHSIPLNNNLITNNTSTKKRQNPPVLTQRRKSEPIRRQPLSQKRTPQRQLRDVGRRNLKKREKKTVLKRKMKSRSSVDDDSQDSWPSPSGPTNNPPGNLMQLRQWIENYEEAVTNHYSPELRARISNLRLVNGQNHALNTNTPIVGGVGIQAPPTAQQDVQVQKCKLLPQPLTGLKIVITTQSLQANSAVIELRGKYMLSTQHRQNSTGTGGLLTRQNSQQRPGPFLFFYRLPKDGTEVCVDTRTYGNDARFIRRSCRPNAELRHCVEKGTLHLYIVTLSAVEKNQELTIRHETHDLAAVGTTNILCACGNTQSCNLLTNNQNNQRKNGHEVVEKVEQVHRKRRGRRISSPALVTNPPVNQIPEVPAPPKNEVTTPPAVSTRRSSSTRASTQEYPREKSQERSKSEVKIPETPVVKEEITPIKENNKSSKDSKKKLTREERKMEAIMKAFERMEKQQQRKQEVQARQAQRRESDPTPSRNEVEEKDSSKIRRKRRKGRSRTISTSHQTSLRSRRSRLNSTDSYMTSGDESSLLSPSLPPDQSTKSNVKPPESPLKNQGSQISDISSPGQVTTAAGLLLALASGGNANPQADKSPQRENDGNSSSSSIQSSPSTPLSSACLLVAAAVGPLEPGFKLPKTKKAIMNEWLNKSPEPQNNSSPVSEPQSDFFQNSGNNSNSGNSKNLATLVQAATMCDSPPQTKTDKSGGNAKKRWLRQAISEECDSPSSRPESPPSEMVAPPKKRRLARESLSSEQSFTPPTTPTMLVPPTQITEDEFINDEEFYESDFKQKGKKGKKESSRVEIIFPSQDANEEVSLEQPEMESDAVLKQRVAEMRMEFSGAQIKRPDTLETNLETPEKAMRILNQQNRQPAPSILDPRLGRCERPIFRDSAQLLGTVEKTIRFYEENFAQPPPVDEKKPEIITPAKRKLSISEYRQRKQLTTTERTSIEENTQTSIPSEPSSPVRAPRSRADSSSSTSSLSSEEEISTINPIISGTTPSSGISESLDKTTGTVGFNSAPTAVELQRENVERLKKVFGLESSTSRDSSTTSPKSLLVSSPRLSPASIKSDIKTETTKYLLSLESKFSDMKYEKTKFSIEEQENEIKFPEITSKLFEKDKETKENNKKPVITKMETTDVVAETKFSETTEYKLHKISPKEEFEPTSEEKSTESVVVEKIEKEECTEEVKEENHDDFSEDKFEDNFIPPFNNPVYPNSTQYTGYSSVIDTCPYEGRNPSPPPSELLNTRLSPYPLESSSFSRK